MTINLTDLAQPRPAHLPALYRYYELRRRAMKLKEIHHYDTYVPILSDLDQKRTWKQAVDAVLGVSSSLGWQALFWRKPLVALGRSHLARWADADADDTPKKLAYAVAVREWGVRYRDVILDPAPTPNKANPKRVFEALACASELKAAPNAKEANR